MHFRRWITSIIALPFLILLIFKGSLPLFSLFIGIACIIALWEYFNIVYHQQNMEKKDSLVLFSYIAGPMIIWAAYKGSHMLILAMVSLNFLAVGSIGLFKFKRDKKVLEKIAKEVLGIIYIPLFLAFLVLIRHKNHGGAWIFWILCLVFIGDTMAFYVGSYFGKHKLMPAVSPKKTIEGSLGGLAGNICIGVLMKILFIPHISWGMIVVFALAVGIAGQAGDLFESILKRSVNIKDSGVIIPGHGGLLDRIDALLFAAPLACIFTTYL